MRPPLSVADDAAPEVLTAQTPAKPPIPQALPVDPAEIERVVGGAHHDPHSVLGPHPYDGGVTLRVLRPLASDVVALLDDGSRHELSHEREGVFVGVLPFAEVRDYRLEVTYPDHEPVTADDPYRFLPTLGEVDIHLIGEGRHEQLWTVLGAHLHEYDGPLGRCAARRSRSGRRTRVGVRLASDVNHWDPAAHPMRSLGSSGVWELFVPGRRRGHPLQVRDPGPGRAPAAQVRPDGPGHRGAPVDRVGGDRLVVHLG